MESVLSEPVTNNLDGKIVLVKTIRKTKTRAGVKEVSLAPGEMTTWLDLIKNKMKNNGTTKK